MPDAKVVFTGDASQLLAEFKKENDAIAKRLEGYKKQKQASQDTARQEQADRRAATKAIQDNLTPQERYNEKVKELDRLLKQGKLSVEQHTRAIDAAGREFDQSGRAATDYGAKVRNIATAIGAGGVLMAGFAAWKQANREIIDQANDIGAAYDEMAKKFRVQSGLRGLQAEQAQNRIFDIANVTAVTNEQATSAATQLVSSGFAVEEATGGALQSFLETLQASNIAGANADPAEMAKAFAQYLNAQGLPLNAESVRMLGQSSQALFKGTNFQVSQLGDLAKSASAIAPLVNQQQQLGAFASLVQRQGSAEASTGLRNTVVRLASASGNAAREEALSRMGLTAADVDFQGEDLVTVLERLREGVESLPAEQRTSTMARLFGEEALTSASNLINNVDEIRQNMAIQQDTEAFRSDVSEATSGRGSAAVRLQNQRERQLLALDQGDDLVSQALENQLRAGGASPFRTGLASQTLRTGRSLGLNQQSALRAASQANNLFSLSGLAQFATGTFGANAASAIGSGGNDQLVSAVNTLVDESRKQTSVIQRQQPPQSPLRQNGR